MSKKEEEEEVEMVTITKNQFDYLVKRDFELECLENGGVDNWEWYYDSLKDGGYFEKYDG